MCPEQIIVLARGDLAYSAHTFPDVSLLVWVNGSEISLFKYFKNAIGRQKGGGEREREREKADESARNKTQESHLSTNK